MTEQHTPGPWEVVWGQHDRPLGISAPADAGIPGAVGCVVRINGIGLPSSAKASANARLIAAAPDLLAACRAAADAFGALNEVGNLPSGWKSGVWSTVQKAINKATGQC